MTKKLIQALEPRMMLDGAAVATAIDTIDDLSNLNKTDLDKKTKENNLKMKCIGVNQFLVLVTKKQKF